MDEDGSGGGGALAGCSCAAALAGGLVATALAVTLALALVVGTAFAGLFHAAGGTRAAPRAGVVGLADLGFGPADAARIEQIIAALVPSSPLRGYGADIVAAARRWHIDPLLLVGVWMQESGLCTTGLNTPANGNWNCGNLIWAAAAPYAGAYGCAPGGASLGHQWAFCPSAAGGIGIWFAYVATSPVYAGVRTFADFAAIYNPCSDPANAANGFACGAAYAEAILALLATAAGPPADRAGFWIITGGRTYPITQEFGRTDFSTGAGRDNYGYGAAYGLPADAHPGIDVGTPAGTPLSSPVDGVVEIAGGSGYYRDEDEPGVDPATSGELRLRCPNGDLVILGHLRRITVRVGQAVRAGQSVGVSGSANGPHVHVEVRVVDPALASGYRVVDPHSYLGE